MLSPTRLRRLPRLAAGAFALLVLVTPQLLFPSAVFAQSPDSAAEAGQAGPVARVAETMNPINWPWPKLRNPNWKMPNFKSLLPGQDDRERIVKKKNGLVDDVSTTAKKSWAKTKEVLNPQKLNPMNLLAPPEQTASRQKKQSPGFFQSIFGPAEEPEERVANVQDFLGQPRPGP